MFYVPASSPNDWKMFLAEPEKQWKDGFSAKSLAYAWHDAAGFPATVKTVFQSSQDENISSLSFIMGFPEYKVDLPGGTRASQNDIFVLAKNNSGLLPIVVEGKVNESFGPYVSEWLSEKNVTSHERLNYLVNLLNLQGTNINNIRYQLLHRTASAIIMAQTLCCNSCLMLVHSFSDNNTSFEDYRGFTKLLNVDGNINTISDPAKLNSIDVYFGWVKK